MNKDIFVFLDIDGTIYTPKTGVPDSTKEAIDKLKKNGHHPVISTGRTRIMIFDQILELGFDGILAGVGSYGEWKGDILFNDGISQEETKLLVDGFLEHGFNPFPEGPDHLYYCPEVCDEPEKVIKRIFSLEGEDLLRPYHEGVQGIAKVSAGFTEKSDPKGFEKQIEGKYFAINHHNILLETFPVGTTKGLGIRKLIEHLGGDMENTYAYGDSFNDLEMLETVKYGVCMENGDPKLLKRFPLHAPRLDEDGLYYSLKSFGLI